MRMLGLGSSHAGSRVRASARGGGACSAPGRRAAAGMPPLIPPHIPPHALLPPARPPFLPLHQDNLLWDRLTAREHLLFYGRLKNLKARGGGWVGERVWAGGCMCGWVRALAAGFAPLVLAPPRAPPPPNPPPPPPPHTHPCAQGAELKHAVDTALRSVNLFNGGVGDKQVSWGARNHCRAAPPAAHSCTPTRAPPCRRAGLTWAGRTPARPSPFACLPACLPAPQPTHQYTPHPSPTYQCTPARPPTLPACPHRSASSAAA